MIVPLVNDARVYDGIVSTEIIGSKISPCENYLAIVTRESLQIVSNRHNRVLISRYILSGSREGPDGAFSGYIDWSGNSRLIVLGSSTEQHALVFLLHLHSPLEVSNESGYLSDSGSSITDDERDETFENEPSANGRRELETFPMSGDSVSKANSNERFVFVTEEIENGLVNVPSVNVPDEIFGSFQEDLLSFQLISEYGTLTEKRETASSETGIEFSTSYARLELVGTINVFHKFDSLLVIFDQETGGNVVLFALKELPVLALFALSCLKSTRRNIFLTDLVSFCEHGRGDGLPYLRENISFSIPDSIYNLGPNKRNCFGGYLDTSCPSREISLDALDRLNVTVQIQESIRDLQLSRLSPKWSEDFLESGKSLMATLLGDGNPRSDFSGLGVGNLEFNEIHDWLTMLVRPLNSLLLFSWNSPLSFGHPDRSDSRSIPEAQAGFVSSADFSAPLSPFGLVVKTRGVLVSRTLKKQRRIVTICDDSAESTEQFGVEFEICDDHLERQNSFGWSDLKRGLDSSLQSKGRELFVEVLSLEDAMFSPETNDLSVPEESPLKSIRVSRIFLLGLSELVCSTSLFSKAPKLTVSSNDLYLTLMFEDAGVFVISSFSGKLQFKVGQSKDGDPKAESSALFKHALLISNDLAMLYQFQLKTGEEPQDKFRLVELPTYKLLETRSSFCSLSRDDRNPPSPCEGLVFLGMESLGVLQCNYRNFRLDSDEPSELASLNTEKISVRNLTCRTSGGSSLGGAISSCLEFQTDLVLQSIPVPPSIYINHNWPIREAHLNKSGNYILVSGYRGCAIYDLTSSRWRLFCDLSHELLLCKPDMLFGWAGEWVFFLSVDSSLLLNTFHDLITSDDDVWQVSAFEKNKLYEAYIQNLSRKLRTGRAHAGGEETCIVFFDVRNSLDVRNVVGLIPFCSSCPILVASGISKLQDDLFILYTDDFVLTAYASESSLQDCSSVPSEVQWVVDLSGVWSDHPVEICLVRKCPEVCTFIVLSKSWRLHRLAVFYQQAENSLNKKCDFRIEPLSQACGCVQVEENIARFGFVEFRPSRPDPGRCSRESTETASCSNQVQVLEDALRLLQDELELPESVPELLNSSDLRQLMESSLDSGRVSSVLASGKSPPLYWDSIEELDIAGIIWYLTESQQVFFLPLVEEEGQGQRQSGPLKHSSLAPIFVLSLQNRAYHTHIVNYFPGLSSFVALESLACKKQTRDRQLDSFEPRILLTLCQSLSPVLQDLVNIPNKSFRSKIIRELLHPMVSYVKTYPLEGIIRMLINILENMLIPILKDSCRDYKKRLDELVEKMVLLSKKTGLVSESTNEKRVQEGLKELIYTVGPNLKVCKTGSCGSCRKTSLVEMLQREILRTSPNIQEMIQTMEVVQEALELASDPKAAPLAELLSSSGDLGNPQMLRVFTHLVVSIIRKVDPVVASCIVFPVVSQNPNDLFQLCIKIQSYSNAMLYLTILQSFLGPYFVRFEHSLLLLHNILLNLNMTNYSKLLPLASQTLKFVLLIFKPPASICVKVPLSGSPEPISIVGAESRSNPGLDCLVFINKIDGILEFHFLAKLMQIEWHCIIVMCNHLGMNFNSWFSHCLQKYHPLWFSGESLEPFNLVDSSNFSNLVVSIKLKFNLSYTEENIVSLFDETHQNPSTSPKALNHLFLPSCTNSHKSNFEMLLGNSTHKKNPFAAQTIKQFFKAFLSNSFPIPALAIAYACNDVYSVHKLLHDFPSIKLHVVP